MNVAPDKRGLNRRTLRSLEVARVIAVFAALGAILAWIGPRAQQLTTSIVPCAGVMVLKAVVLGGWGRLLFGDCGWTQGPHLALLIHFSSDLVLYGLIPMLAR
ncbi:MAG TPA: hypothetical protein VKM93_23505 [Terriglobia bacterium]|nr:hypothetical protein [Terriglobia bacterium]